MIDSLDFNELKTKYPLRYCDDIQEIFNNIIDSHKTLLSFIKFCKQLNCAHRCIYKNDLGYTAKSILNAEMHFLKPKLISYIEFNFDMISYVNYEVGLFFDHGYLFCFSDSKEYKEYDEIKNLTIDCLNKFNKLKAFL